LSERKIVCADLNRAIDDLGRDGFRLDFLYPAEEPHTALLAREAERIRVTTAPDAPRCSEQLPPFRPEFLLNRAGASPAEGRAGMLYRDLIPGRLGGRYIASHITVTQGGPVADWVHFHRIALQIITIRRGWVRVVYEDQGEPFVMREGDLVLQPPEIRHRVLEASGGLEVIEIGAPALHATFAEHDLQLPNGSNPARLFGGQRFLRHVAADTPWTRFGGGEAQETSIEEVTGGLAEVRTIRSAGEHNIDFPAHDGELVFGFVLDGAAELREREIGPADAFVIPPGEEWRLTALSPDFRLLHVTTARLD
jgi:quercetin dioxygenase-like cupin family protein